MPVIENNKVFENHRKNLKLEVDKDNLEVQVGVLELKIALLLDELEAMQL